MRKTMMLLAAGAAALTAVGAEAQSAQTITFGSLPFGNPLVTSYTESGLTFNVTAGTFSGTSGNGVPPPSVYTPDNSGTAQVTSGGLFTFSSIALGNGALSGTANFTITGLLNSVSLFSFSQSVPALQFNTYTGPAADNLIAIDTLRIQVTGDGNLDNISVRGIPAMTTSVPEPATWAMMMVGVGMIGAMARRRRSTVTTRVQFA